MSRCFCAVSIWAIAEGVFYKKILSERQCVYGIIRMSAKEWKSGKDRMEIKREVKTTTPLALLQLFDLFEFFDN